MKLGDYDLNKKVEWINIARGLGILFVIIGHVQTPEYIKSIIYSFHMPLFFFLSGYVFNTVKYVSALSFVVSRFRKLIIPYFVFSFITIAIFKIWDQQLLGQKINSLDILTGFLFSTSDKILVNAPLWFLTCLFVVQIAFYFVVRITSRNLVVLIILSVSSLLGYLYSKSELAHIPWNVDVALTAVAFFGVGYLLKGKQIEIKNKFEWFSLFSLLCVLFSYINSRHGRVDLFGNILNNYFLYYLAAFFGIAACILASQIIQESKLLSSIGKSSLHIFTTHIIVIYAVNIYVGKAKVYYGFEVYDSMKWMVLYTLIILALSLLIVFCWTHLKNQANKLIKLVGNRKSPSVSTET